MADEEKRQKEFEELIKKRSARRRGQIVPSETGSDSYSEKQVDQPSIFPKPLISPTYGSSPTRKKPYTLALIILAVVAVIAIGITSAVRSRLNDNSVKEPHWQISEAAVKLASQERITSSVTRMLKLRHAGNSPLSWETTVNASWLRIIPSQGNFDGEASSDLEVMAFPNALPAGQYESYIIITDTTKQEESLIITVTLTVNPPDFILTLPPSDLQVHVELHIEQFTHSRNKNSRDLEIRLQLNQDCYVYVMRLLPDSQLVALMFPNPRSTDNFIRAGRYEIPEPGKNYYFQVELDKTEITFAQVIATSQPINLASIGFPKFGGNQYAQFKYSSPLEFRKKLELAIQEVRNAAAAYTILDPNSVK